MSRINLFLAINSARQNLRRENHRARCVRYYDQHRDRVQKRYARYYVENKERIRAKNHEYYFRHRTGVYDVDRVAKGDLI
jgi:nitrite reductase/ring-hydroxylating ferredoxin subunit